MRLTGLWALALTACLAVGCSDDTTTDTGPDVRIDQGLDLQSDLTDAAPPCELTIVSINGQELSTVSKLVADDDQNVGMAGIQLNIQVAAENAADGTELKLSVTGLTPDPTALVSSGMATFTDVTVGPMLSSVLIKAYGGTCSAADVVLPVEPPPECEFVQPADGAALGIDDDKDPGTTSVFEYDVKVKTFNAAGGTVTFKLAGLTQASGTPEVDGNIAFDDVELPEGTGIELTAEVTSGGGAMRTCSATISVDTGQPECNISLTPTPVTTTEGGDGLGVLQDAAPSSPSTIETNINVVTSDTVDTVQLLVDNVVVRTESATGGAAAFSNHTLNDGTREVRVLCLNSQSGNSKLSLPATLLVDASPPPDIADFSCSVHDHRKGQIFCLWTSAGQAAAVQYELRSSTSGSVDSDWGAADVATLLDDTLNPLANPLPSNPQGQAHQVIVTDLAVGTTYYLGLQGQDEVLNASSTATQDALAVTFKQQTLTGDDTTSHWGERIAAGDFNCDGRTDVAIGDPAAAGGKGKVYVYLGDPSGLLASPSSRKVLSGTVADGRFGSRVAAVTSFSGNTVNSNPCADLAVSAFHGESAPAADAKVFVFLGTQFLFNEDDTDAELVFSAGGGADEQLGAAIASAGDFDGDGLGDLALSHHDTGAADAASVLIVFGDAALTINQAQVAKVLPTAADVQITGGRPAEGFGLVLSAGQLDDPGGDTFDDLLIGAPATPVATSGKGAVYVVKGAAGTATIPIASDPRVIAITGADDNQAFGAQVAFVGDMDLATPIAAEFAISDPTAPGNGGAGTVWVFNLDGLPASPTVADFEAVVTNDLPGSAGQQFGLALAAAPTASLGDLNVDGRADLVVGALQGGVYVFHGVATLVEMKTTTADRVFAAPAEAEAFGTRLLWAGDIDDDGYGDLLIGDPDAPTSEVGRGRLLVVR